VVDEPVPELVSDPVELSVPVAGTVPVDVSAPVEVSVPLAGTVTSEPQAESVHSV
jgi:hypothetical protein